MAKKETAPAGSAEQIYKIIEAARDTGKMRRGVNETTKAIERGQAKLVVYAEDIQPPEVVAHLKPLCDEKKIPCLTVPTKKDLGNASGIDVPTSSIAITDAGSAREQVAELENKLKSK